MLLASTAVPVWSRSRRFLGPIFISTATLTGAAATRLVLSAGGMAGNHPTRVALGRVEDGAIAAELILSQINEHRLGELGVALSEGEGGRWFNRAKWLTRAALAARMSRGRLPEPLDHGASVAYLAAALCYRFGWVRAGRTSAHDDVAVARNARAGWGSVGPPPPPTPE